MLSLSRHGRFLISARSIREQLQWESLRRLEQEQTALLERLNKGE